MARKNKTSCYFFPIRYGPFITKFLFVLLACKFEANRTCDVCVAVCKERNVHLIERTFQYWQIGEHIGNVPDSESD